MLTFQSGDNEVIDLDDEEEIDDVEKDDKNKAAIDAGIPKKSAAAANEKAVDASEPSGSSKRSLDEEGGDESQSKKAKTDAGGD